MSTECGVLCRIQVLFCACSVAAKDIWIQVGHNETGDASTVFQPQRISANLGDTVFFNFTLGNHTATQSTFDSPCIPAHDTNVTINGFNSQFRDAGNGTAITILAVPMLPQNVNETMWFFDYNTCGQGGVGVINDNETSTETLDGFVRNAIRLNGTDNNVTSSSSSSETTTASTTASSGTSHSSAATRTLTLGTLGVAPLLIMGLLLN
ncbi:hypothetical protein DENSPDRAFT_785159 [Dentipellis sp. KUC8613]|nr:hypothetical protein DENSPDRAFT_785159 [Dentipellis sp. KUC8613]